MHIRNGQPFDIHARHTIDDVQYPAEWFQLHEHLEPLGIIEVPDQAPPAIAPHQRVELVKYVLEGDEWKAQWQVRNKTAAELAVDAAVLEAAKQQKRAEINASRDAANGTTFPYKGKHIQCDTLSKTDILGTALNIALFGTFPAGFPGAWKYEDNSYEMMPTIEDFKPMYAAFTQAGSGNFMYAQSLKTQVEAAQTLAEVAVIRW